MVAEHGIRTPDLHPFLLEPPHQAEQLTVTVKWVAAQVTEGERGRDEVTKKGNISAVESC